MKGTIIVTVFYETPFWVGVFERNDEGCYAVARKIFGNEPTDAELYEFVLRHYRELKFSAPRKEIKLIIKRKNPKRQQREVRKEMQKVAVGKYPMTLAQEALKLELEKNKKIRKDNSKQKKEVEQQEKFNLKQLKKKQKKRGH